MRYELQTNLDGLLNHIKLSSRLTCCVSGEWEVPKKRNSVVLSRDESKFRQVQPMYIYFIHYLNIYCSFGAVVVFLCCCAIARWFESCPGILYFDTLSQLRPESHWHAGNAGNILFWNVQWIYWKAGNLCTGTAGKYPYKAIPAFQRGKEPMTSTVLYRFFNHGAQTQDGAISRSWHVHCRRSACVRQC